MIKIDEGLMLNPDGESGGKSLRSTYQIENLGRYSLLPQPARQSGKLLGLVFDILMRRFHGAEAR